MKEYLMDTTPDITLELLEPVVRKRLGSASASVADWEIVPLASSGSIYLLRGEALDGGAIRPWKLELRIVTAGAAPEPLFEPGSIIARDERQHGRVWIWTAS